MLENLSQQVRDCLRLAEECGNNAKVERDSGLVRDFLDMERRYLSLARSYQFSERLESFTKHNKKRQADAAEILDRMAHQVLNED